MSQSKGKLSLCTPRRYTRIEGVQIQLCSFLASAIDGGEWSASLSCFTPGEKGSSAAGWAGPRASLDARDY